VTAGKPDGFPERYGPWAVIAGGSDGIGAAYAREAARRGLHVALIARRPEPLAALAREIESEHAVETRCIQADLTSADVVSTIASATGSLDVGLFVYNAGSDRETTRFLDRPVEDALFLARLSCRGPILLAHHFGGRLRARGRGGIVLMSSLVGLAGSHLHAVYAATKAFDTTLAEGLWHEFASDGVDVLGVLAGATRTETMLAQQPDAFESAMDPAEVAMSALDRLGTGPVWVPGEANRAAVQALWPAARVPTINAMSQASAELAGVELAPVEGIEFHER
jgi:short-subunit dehydrogenase